MMVHGEWSSCLYLHPWAFHCIFFRCLAEEVGWEGSLVGTWWQTKVNPLVKILPFCFQRPDLGGQRRNNLMNKLSIWVISSGKPGRQKGWDLPAPPEDSLHEDRPMHSFRPCFPHTQDDHRGCLHCYISKLHPKNRLSTLPSALEGLLLPALPGLLQRGRIWACLKIFFAVPTLQQVLWIKARLSASEGLYNLVKFEFHRKTIWPITSSRCRVLREKQKGKASVEPSFLQVPMICSSGNTWARGSFCMSGNLQGSLYSQQK